VAQRDADDGCATLRQLLAARKLSAPMCGARRAWRWKPTAPVRARAAVEIVAPDALPRLREALDSPSKYLRAHSTARGRMRQELVLLALIKLAAATSNPPPRSWTAAGACTCRPKSATGPGA
jgi:soluble lytic murein transglycosylase